MRQSCPACTCVASWRCRAQSPSCSPHGALGAAAPPAFVCLALKEPLGEGGSFSPSGRGGLPSGREGLAFLMSAQQDQIEEEESTTWKWGSTNYELAAGSCWRGQDAVSLPSQVLAWRPPGCMDLRPGMAPLLSPPVVRSQLLGPPPPRSAIRITKQPEPAEGLRRRGDCLSQ